MRRRKRKQNKMILISFISLLFLFSVGYCAFSSDFLINGKGIIVERGVSIGGVQNEIVSSGDGIYKDEYEEDRYVYKGLSVNNYIKLGNDMYRIISKESDDTLKVIKNSTIGNIAFDEANYRYSTNSSDYCISVNGCKVWGSKTTLLSKNLNSITKTPLYTGGESKNLPSNEASINTYLNTTFYNSLSEDVKEVIKEHVFNVGALSYGSKVNISMSETREEERNYKWVGNVGLMNITDYVNASNYATCETLYDYGYVENCYANVIDYNWLFDVIVAKYPWSINPCNSNNSECVLNIYYQDYSVATNYPKYERATFPVFYLKYDIRLNGTGTKDDPYVLVN